MNRAALAPLLKISGLILDTKLAELRHAAKQRDDSLARLADLSEMQDPTDLPLAVAAQAGMRYARWADARRAEINLTLARQTAKWIDAQDAARQAFGRAEALRNLSAQLPR